MQTVDVKKAFGISLKAWRKRFGLSQEELAEKADLHRTYVSDVERGSRNLSLESITRMAQALNISVCDLFPTETHDSRALDTARARSSGDIPWIDIVLMDSNVDQVRLAMGAFKKARLVNSITVLRDGRQATEFLFGEGKAGHRPAVNNARLVFLDIHLAKANGWDLLRRIKEQQDTAGIPVVILTQPGTSAGEECGRLGAEICVEKPFTFDTLQKVAGKLNLDWLLGRRPAQKSKK